MPRSKAVLVVGDLNADLILTGLAGRPRYGREVLVRECSLTLGGSGALCATGLARLGRPVRFVGLIGRDSTGDMLLEMMRRRGVDVSRVRRDGKCGTGIAVALSNESDRAFVSFLGTVATATSRTLALDGFAGFAHLHLTSPFLQAGLRPDFPLILKKAREAGLTTSFDPGWDPAEEWKLGDLYPWTDILLVNEVEAAAITGLRRPAAAARALSARVKVAVVKTGPEGAVAASGDDAWRVSSYPVKPVDTTGAGDTFDAGFLDATLEGKGVEEALAFGCACGAISTTRPGGFEGQPSRAEALRLMRSRR